jgi:hypothetical protein
VIDALFASLNTDAARKVATTAGMRIGRQVVRRLPALEQAAYSWLDQFGKGKITVAIDASDLGTSSSASSAGRVPSAGRAVAGAARGLGWFARPRRGAQAGDSTRGPRPGRTPGSGTATRIRGPFGP